MTNGRWQYLALPSTSSAQLSCAPLRLLQAAAEHLVGGAQAQRFDRSAESFTGLAAHDIIKWHIKPELDKCAPWPSSHF
jgi:hypothetical protein